MSSPIEIDAKHCVHGNCVVKEISARSLCVKHYKDAWHRGTLEQYPKNPRPSSICSEEDCYENCFSRGWCGRHYRELMPRRTCESPDPCTRQTSAPSKRLCSTHEYRKYRGYLPDGSDMPVRPGQGLIRDSDGNKRCSACKRWQSEDSFRAQKTTADGLTSACVECLAIQRRARRFGNSAQSLVAKQDFRCAICGDRLTGGFMIDHDHSCCSVRTYKTCGDCVRGALCRGCNLGLGNFKDDEDTLASAINYLRLTRTSPQHEEAS